MDPRNPHNSYRYKPMDQAAPSYIPPSNATKRILPVPQAEGQSDYHYGRPGEAVPSYIPSSADSKKAKKMKPGVAMSDEHSKKNIERLTAKNDALMAALDEASQNQGGNMPPTEYPKVPSYTRGGARVGESHQNFADRNPEEFDAWADQEGWSRDPADKVAAQNVGLQQAASPAPPQAPRPVPPQAMQPNPQQANFARSQNPAFNVGGGMPDMSALDEAYRRQGMGG